MDSDSALNWVSVDVSIPNRRWPRRLTAGSGGGRERFVGGYASTAWGCREVEVVFDSSGTGETDGMRLVPLHDEGRRAGERGEIGADVEVDPVAAGCDGSFAEVSVS